MCKHGVLVRGHTATAVRNTVSARELGYVCDRTTQSDTQGAFACLKTSSTRRNLDKVSQHIPAHSEFLHKNKWVNVSRNGSDNSQTLVPGH